MVEFKIANIISHADISNNLNLVDISFRIGNVKTKRNFAGVIYKTSDPKATILLFKTGKLVCTGARDFEDSKKAVNMLINDLHNAGIDIAHDIDLKISNIVVSGEFNSELNLNKLLYAIGIDKIEYFPEQFPAAVYKMYDPKTVILIFSNGKFIATGSTSLDTIQNNLNLFERELIEMGLIN